MPQKIAQLDYSNWTNEQLARKAKLDANQQHPLRQALKRLTPESWDETIKSRWRMKSRDFGNGHKECAVWLHSPDPLKKLNDSIDHMLGHNDVERGEGDREESIKRATRRAKQGVRLKCKTMCVNSLWTLTYRENVTDRALALKHLDAFARKVRAVLGDWVYIAVMEKQERGAIHFHLATHALPVRLLSGGVKVKSWDVMRGIWRAVTREYGGNFDEAKRDRWGANKHKRKAVRGAGAIASYISGYVAKDMQDSELNKKRYSSSKGIEIPQAVIDEWPEGSVGVVELIELAYAAVGDRITRAWWCAESQVFFIESDDSLDPTN